MKFLRKITLIEIATEQLEDAERGALAAHADLEHAQHVLALNLARAERLREYLAIRKVATTALTPPEPSMLVKHWMKPVDTVITAVTAQTSMRQRSVG